ncbi:glycosyltransferase family 2 protein [Chryseobacterium sp. T1]
MNNLALISVIVPIYKVESYLRECVDSIIGQTYTNLEIILVDDGSPDRCGEICDEYATKDSRVIVIHKENGGLSDARNVGLDICKGDYISFIDSDDFVHPQFIEVLYTNLVFNEADISFCNFIRFTSSDSIKQTSKTEGSTEVFKGDYMINNLYNNTWVPKNIVVWNKLYKLNIFSSLRFEKGFVHEDELIFTDLFENNYKIIYTDIDLIYYREREGSIMTSNFSLKKIESQKRIYDKRNKFFRKEKRYDLIKLNKKSWLIYLGYWMLNDKSKKRHLLTIKDWVSILSYKEFHWKSKMLLILKLFHVN